MTVMTSITHSMEQVLALLPKVSNICSNFFNLNNFVKEWNAVDPLQSLHSVKQSNVKRSVQYIR